MTAKSYPNIEAERARHGLSVEQLTQTLGVTRKTFYNWIAHGEIPQSKAEKMAAKAEKAKADKNAGKEKK